jgi:hypothetical protein
MSRLPVPTGHTATSALRAVTACARTHTTPQALGCFHPLSGPTVSGFGPDLAQALLSVYSFLKFVFHLKFLGNSFKVQKFIEKEIKL